MEFTADDSVNVARVLDHYNKLIFNHLDPESNPDLLEDEKFDGTFWIAGGCLRDFFMGKLPTDVDLFFPNEVELNKVKNALIEKGFEVIFENENADMLKGRFETGPAIQFDLVKHYAETPEEIYKQFDFTVACAALDRENFYCADEFLFDLASRRLTVNSLPYPVATMRRIPKYIKKGFMPCKGTMQELAAAVASMDPKEVAEQEGFYFD